MNIKKMTCGLLTAAVLGVSAAAITATPAVAYPGGMNEAEASWCQWPSRWRVCASAYGSEGAEWAMQHAANCAIPDFCTNGDEANALQHCLWSAILKAHHGEGTAMGFLKRHEANSNGDADSQRDWQNNAKGFAVADAAAPEVSQIGWKGAILGRCAEMARTEQLVYIR